jgi:hypothetical protein
LRSHEKHIPKHACSFLFEFHNSDDSVIHRFDDIRQQPNDCQDIGSFKKLLFQIHRQSDSEASQTSGLQVVRLNRLDAADFFRSNKFPKVAVIETPFFFVPYSFIGKPSRRIVELGLN